MENLKKLTDKIQEFYALVESHESDIQNCVQKAKKPLHSITNQSVFYRSAVLENSVVNTPFEHIKGFREALVQNIFASLQEEYNHLEDIRNKIHSANKIIQKEQLYLENLYCNLISEGSLNLRNLNPCCPAFEHIIQWSQNIWCYYHLFCLQISQALLKLRYENESTVKHLVLSFLEDAELKKQINKIRSYKFFEFEFYNL